jgi:hypothetical protein
MHGLITTFKSLFTTQKKKAKTARTLPAVSSAILLALAASLAGSGTRLEAQAATSVEGQQAGATAKPAYPPPLPGQFRDVFSLADAGASQIELHGIDSNHTVYFTLPQTHVPRTAKVHLSYAFSPSLLPQLSQIKLMMNGTLFGTVQPTPNGTGGSSPQVGEADFSIPPELMVHNNAITIQFIGHYVMVCEDPANTAVAPGRRPETFASSFSRSRGGAAAEPAGGVCLRPFNEGDPGGRDRDQLLRNDLGEPAGAFPGEHWCITRGQCDRDFRQRLQSAGGPEHADRRLADDCGENQSQ